MTYSRDPDALIQAFLDDGISELPDSSYDVVRASIEHTRQRVVLGPWREEQVNRLAILGVAAAAIVLAVVVGLQFLPDAGGVGGPPPATPTPAPTPTPSPTPPPTPAPTPVEDPSGRLEPGTYVAHPFGEPNRGMSFTFDVPSNSWEAHSDPGNMIGIVKVPTIDGVGLGFLLVDSLNGDPCKWDGSLDNVAVGATVDDLVAALTISDDYEVSEPQNVTLGEHSGKKVVITMPATLQDRTVSDGPQPGCHSGAYRIWNAEGWDIYAQGPQHHWETWVVDVQGTTVVMMMTYFDDTDAGRVGELRTIAESVVISAP